MKSLETFAVGAAAVFALLMMIFVSSDWAGWPDDAMEQVEAH